jgi:hypothetical protein
MVALLRVPGGRPGLPRAEGAGSTGLARFGTVVPVGAHVSASQIDAIAFNIRRAGLCTQHSKELAAVFQSLFPGSSPIAGA